MFIKKGMKYGYSVESTRDDNMARIVKPSNLRKILLTPTNSKFVFYGTRNDILKWMSSHSELLVEYNPLDQDNNEPAFSPPSSPLFSTFPEVPEILSCSPTSISSISSPSSPTSPSSSHSTNTTSSISKKSHDITFDLFAIPTKTLIDDSAFSRQRSIALKLLPWLEVMLEIRPTDEYNDSKLYPVHRVILPSGSSLSEISKALEKSWKSLIPDSSDCFIKNSELFFLHKKSKSNPSLKISTTNSNEVEGNEYHSREKPYNFMAGVAKRVPTVDLWFRQKQTTGVIPPGVLTPYIIDDVLENSEETKKEDEKIHLNKREEAELDKELPTADLPQYETVFNDTLLERGNKLSI